MLKSVLNKIANNIWLFACLVVGSLLITAILASIPIYADGALKKMLVKDMKASQVTNNQNPGQTYIKVGFSSGTDSFFLYNTLKDIRKETTNNYNNCGVPITTSFERYSIEKLKTDEDNALMKAAQFKLESITNLQKNLDIVSGRMYSDQRDGDVYEVIVSKSNFNNRSMQLDRIYTFKTSSSSSVVLKVKVVGVYEPKVESYNYWYNLNTIFTDSMFMSTKVFENDFINEKNAAVITSASYFYDLDFYKVTISKMGDYVTSHNSEVNYLKSQQTINHLQWEYNAPIVKILVSYFDKTSALRNTMWVLNAPVIIMLAFYIYMVSRLIIEEDSNEIAVFKSRGCHPFQIFTRYVIECGLIVGVSLIIGPPLGMFISQMIGSSNGFLEFVSRTKLELHLLPNAYLYAIIAGLFFMITVLLPAYMATKNTIVQHKHKKARIKKSSPIAFIFYILLLASSLALLYFYDKINVLVSQGSGKIDSLQYFISTMFIISCGLIFLTIYPKIIKFFFWLFKRILPPSLYASMVQVSRSGGDNRFLMLFLIMTISLGVYSANSARIINANVEDTSRYQSGADIKVEPYWGVQGNVVVVNTQQTAKDKVSGITQVAKSVVTVNYADFESISGIQSMTKVFRVDNVRVGRESGYTLMAIEPSKFADVAFLRDDLNNKQLSEYTKLLKDGTAIITRQVATGIEDDADRLIPLDAKTKKTAGNAIKLYNKLPLKYKVGGDIQVNFEGLQLGEFENSPYLKVAAIVDFWPAEMQSSVKDSSGLIIVSYDYLMSLSPEQNLPYEIWMKKKTDTTSKQIYDSISQKGIKIATLTDITKVLNEKKNDSLLMALNGAFSMGFIATMTVSFIGFLIYWIMSIRKRRLQFGILRAIGVSRSKMTVMMLWEHLMTSGVAVVAGMLIGSLTVKLFVPLLQTTYMGNIVLPLRIVTSTADNIKVYATVVLMIITGIFILSRFIAKLKINEAVKLGED